MGVVSYTPRPLYPPGKEHLVHIGYEARWASIQNGELRKTSTGLSEINLSFTAGI
jgi:hypothetical protein